MVRTFHIPLLVLSCVLVDDDGVCRAALLHDIAGEDDLRDETEVTHRADLLLVPFQFLLLGLKLTQHLQRFPCLELLCYL